MSHNCLVTWKSDIILFTDNFVADENKGLNINKIHPLFMKYNNEKYYIKMPLFSCIKWLCAPVCVCVCACVEWVYVCIRMRLSSVCICLLRAGERMAYRKIKRKKRCVYLWVEEKWIIPMNWPKEITTIKKGTYRYFLKSLEQKWPQQRNNQKSALMKESSVFRAYKTPKKWQFPRIYYRLSNSCSTEHVKLQFRELADKHPTQFRDKSTCSCFYVNSSWLH